MSSPDTSGRPPVPGASGPPTLDRTPERPVPDETPRAPAEPAAGGLAPAWLFAFVALYVFPYQPEINNPNENVRLYMTAAIVEDGAYTIDGPWARWGWVNDAAVHHGRRFSVKAPGTSLLGVPGYAAYQALAAAADRPFDRTTALWCCRMTASALPMFLFLGWLAGWLRRRGMGALARDTMGLTLGLGSLTFGYALMFVSHTTSALCAFAAFALLWDHRDRMPGADLGTAFGAGLLAAGVTFFEYPGLVVSVVLTGFAVAVFRRRPGALGLFALGGALPTLAVMHFQWVAFENPFSPGHLHVENPAFRAIHETGFFGATGLHPDAAWGLLFDLDFGLFPSTPTWVLAPIGFGLLLRRPATRGPAGVALAGTLLTYLAICFMDHWRGGWTLGPRYLATVVPFVAWAAAVALDRFEDRAPTWAAVLAVGTVGAAIVLSGIPSVWYPHLPPDLDRPMANLFPELIAGGYAPTTAAHALGLTGSLTTVPLALVALAALVRLAAGPGGSTLRELGVLLMGLALGAVVLAPFVADAPADPATDRAVRFVKDHWHPSPGRDAGSDPGPLTP